MPVFRCEKCGCVENTAIAWWWSEGRICTECKTGKWHKRFPKQSAIGMFEDKNGFLYSKEELEPGGYFYGRVEIEKEIKE